MKRFLPVILLLVLPGLLSAQLIRPKIIRGEGVLGDAATPPWQGGWFGGSSPTAITAAENDWLPATTKEEKPLDLTKVKNPAPVFYNPIGMKKGSLKIGFNLTGGAWGSAIVAAGEPWGWANVDVTGRDTLMIWVKGTTGTEGWKIKPKFGEIDGKEVEIAKFLPEGRITTSWQQATIPLDQLVDITKVDLTKFASIGGPLSGSGPCIMYVDNIIFYKSQDAAPAEAPAATETAPADAPAPTAPAETGP